MEIQKLLNNELNHLRDELLNLKKCQITFFTLSISATALLLSIAFKFDDKGTLSIPPHLQILLSLSPLLILLPCWWIIFDKASTITRIVGYYRVIESSLTNNLDVPIRYIGWENALKEFRQKQNTLPISDYTTPKCKRSIKKLFFSLKTAHRFWVIIWWTYFILSFLCIIIAVMLLLCVHKHEAKEMVCGNMFIDYIDNIIIISGFVIFVWSAYVTSMMVCRLVYGRYSYNANEKIWIELLKAIAN